VGPPFSAPGNPGALVFSLEDSVTVCLSLKAFFIEAGLHGQDVQFVEEDGYESDQSNNRKDEKDDENDAVMSGG